MKIILIMLVCSFLSVPSVCMPPITFPEVYDSWLECSKAAHVQSLELLRGFDPDFINKNKAGMKYMCRQDTLY